MSVAKTVSYNASSDDLIRELKGGKRVRREIKGHKHARQKYQIDLPMDTSRVLGPRTA